MMVAYVQQQYHVTPLGASYACQVSPNLAGKTLPHGRESRYTGADLYNPSWKKTVVPRFLFHYFSPGGSGRYYRDH